MISRNQLCVRWRKNCERWLRLSRVSHPPFVGYRKYYIDVQRREEAFDLSGVEHPMGAFTSSKGVSLYVKCALQVHRIL